MPIKGVHAMFYSSKADEMRAFIKEKLALPYTDVGEGWLIFDLPAGDLGVHPTDGDPAPGTHDVSFWCDRIEKTVAELEARGVRFEGGVEDHGYGLVTYFTMPGNVRVQLYEPRYRKRAARPKPGAKPKPKRATATRARARRPAQKRRATK